MLILVGGTEDGAICWDVLREMVVGCGGEASGRGEGGTELRSGAILLGYCSSDKEFGFIVC